MRIKRGLDTIYCTLCTLGPWRYKGEWILFTVHCALQNHEDTKEIGYYLLYTLHFRTMKLQRRVDTIYCTVCTSGPRRYKGEWILFTVQFVLQGQGDTKESGYYLLYSLHFRTMKIQRRLDTIYCTVCTSGPWRYKGDWILFTVQLALQGHEDTKESGYSLLHSLNFRAMKIQRRLDTIYCTFCTSGPWRYKGDWVLFTVHCAI